MTFDPEIGSRIHDLEQAVDRLTGKQTEIREKIGYMEGQVGRIDHLETLLMDTLTVNEKLIEQVKSNIETISKVLVLLEEKKSGDAAPDS